MVLPNLSPEDLKQVIVATQHVAQRGHTVDPEGFSVEPHRDGTGGFDLTTNCTECGADLIIRTGCRRSTLGLAGIATCEECLKDEIMRLLVQGSVVILSSEAVLDA